MAMKLGRTGFIACVGMLLSAAGCSVAADREDPREVGSIEQASRHSDCVNECESDYNDHYYMCQIGPNDWFCYQMGQMNLDMCLMGCPEESWSPPDPTGTPIPYPEPWPDPSPGPSPPSVEPGCDHWGEQACRASCAWRQGPSFGACVGQCMAGYCNGN